MMIKKEYRGQKGFLSYAAFVYILALLFLAGLASGVCASELTDIDISGNTIKLKANAPIKYSINKSSDPFNLTIDISGIAPGKTGGKISPKNSVVSEANIEKIESSMMITRIQLMMTSPLSPVAELKGDTLIVKLEAAAAEPSAARSDAPAVSASVLNDKTAASMLPAKAVTSVFFDKTDKAVELIIKGDGAMPDPVVYEIGNKVMVDLLGIEMSASLPVNVPAPFKNMKHKAQKGKAAISFELASGVKKEVLAVNDEIIVSVALKSDDSKAAESMDGRKKETSLVINNGGGMVSLDFQDADIVPIIRLLGDVSGYNVVIHPDVKGKISMKLTNVQWTQAMELVLKTFNLHSVTEDNVIRIATIKAFQDERKAEAETKELLTKAEDIETKVFVVNYANAEKVMGTIEKAKVLSPRGSIGFDQRTRSLVVKDVKSSLDQIEILVASVDKQTPQVLIEARIAEVSKGFSRSLGIEWGLRARPFEWSSSISGSAGTGVAGGIGSPLGIGLPAATSKSPLPTSAVTFGYLNVAQTFGLDMRLSAIEDAGKGKTIASPKVMTLENEQATIRHGKKIPVSTRDKDGNYTTVYIDANLKLTVTPQVSTAGTISMKIEVNKDEPDWTNKDVLGNPAIDTRSAQTQVLINDGETIVIGGIFKSISNDVEAGVPLLSKIPVLGNLFKKQTVEERSEELIIFITPRLITKN